MLYTKHINVDEALQFVEQILAYQETNPSLDGAEEPLRIYLTCYRVLQANRNPKAYQLLQTTYQLLKDRAAKISDPEIRHGAIGGDPVRNGIRTDYKQCATRMPAITSTLHRVCGTGADHLPRFTGSHSRHPQDPCHRCPGHV